MNNNATIEKLKQMRLTAMAQLHSQSLSSEQYRECSHDEYLVAPYRSRMGTSL